MSQGIVITQQGIPIDGANDYQKVLDSRWKFLDIYTEKYIDVTFDLTGQPTGAKKLLLLHHSLPYAAAFEFIPSSQSIHHDPFSEVSFIPNDTRSFEGGIYYAPYWFSGSDRNIFRIKGLLRVYALDLRETYKAPSTPLTLVKTSANARYGAKFLDPNRGGTNVDESDPRNFTLHTPTKQISIHMAGIVQAVSGIVTIEHDVGYPPSYMMCDAVEIDSEIVYGPLFESFAVARATTYDLKFQGVQASFGNRKFGYLIIKDPLEIAA